MTARPGTGRISVSRTRRDFSVISDKQRGNGEVLVTIVFANLGGFGKLVSRTVAGENGDGLGVRETHYNTGR